MTRIKHEVLKIPVYSYVNEDFPLVEIAYTTMSPENTGALQGMYSIEETHLPGPRCRLGVCWVSTDVVMCWLGESTDVGSLVHLAEYSEHFRKDPSMNGRCAFLETIHLELIVSSLSHTCVFHATTFPQNSECVRAGHAFDDRSNPSLAELPLTPDDKMSSLLNSEALSLTASLSCVGTVGQGKGVPNGGRGKEEGEDMIL